MAEVKEAFPEIGPIRYEGPSSKNMLAFHHYNADALVEGVTMRDHLRFAVAYWHTFRGTGSDPFGSPTMIRPWETAGDPLTVALNRTHVAFEFMEKLGVGFYCFHDRDVAPEGRTLAESNSNLDAVADLLESHQKRSGIRLLWGTANLFSHPRYVHGAATSPNVESFAYAAAQTSTLLPTFSSRIKNVLVFVCSGGLPISLVILVTFMVPPPVQTWNLLLMQQLKCEKQLKSRTDSTVPATRFGVAEKGINASGTPT